MSENTTKVWFINGQLVTNNPSAFAKEFDLPATAPVDGLTRVSHRPQEMKRRCCLKPQESEGGAA